jgi:putative zinc finger/helix-turn-helix YgiT family protein
MWHGHVERFGFKIDAHGQRCGACGETLFDLSDVKHQQRRLAKEIVGRGVRTGPEFKLVRKIAGLRAADLAELLDVRPETISRWENGAIEIPRAVAYVLDDLFAHPKIARGRLAALAAR